MGFTCLSDCLAAVALLRRDRPSHLPASPGGPAGDHFTVYFVKGVLSERECRVSGVGVVRSQLFVYPLWLYPLWLYPLWSVDFVHCTLVADATLPKSHSERRKGVMITHRPDGRWVFDKSRTAKDGNNRVIISEHGADYDPSALGYGSLPVVYVATS